MPGLEIAGDRDDVLAAVLGFHRELQQLAGTELLR